MASPRGMVADATESAVPLFVGALAIVLPAGLLLLALIDHASFRHPIVPVVVWLGMLAAAAWLAPRARSGDLSAGQAAIAVAVAVAAVTAIGLDRRPHSAVAVVDWAILGTVWLLALVAVTSPPKVWVPGSALVAGVHAVFVVRALGAGPLGLSRLAASAYALCAVLATAAALRPSLRTHAGLAVRRAELASRSAAERAAAAAIDEVRRGRLGRLELEALPLLRGIAGGTLDPADSAVRERCAQHAAALRRALVDRSRAGGLMAGLEPVLTSARERNVPVEVQMVGDPGRVSEDVVRVTLAAVGTVLRALPPQQAILTVLAAGEEAELYLTFERAPAGMCAVPRLGDAVPAAAAWRASLEVEDTGPGCLEVRWRIPVPE
jgi:hypothetical protein